MDVIQKIAEELQVKSQQVNAAVALLDEGATVPFIARYRKERTGEMDEVQLRDLFDRHAYLQELEERKSTILKAISEQGKLLSYSPLPALAQREADNPSIVFERLPF